MAIWMVKGLQPATACLPTCKASALSRSLKDVTLSWLHCFEDRADCLPLQMQDMHCLMHDNYRASCATVREALTLR